MQEFKEVADKVHDLAHDRNILDFLGVASAAFQAIARWEEFKGKTPTSAPWQVWKEELNLVCAALPDGTLVLGPCSLCSQQNAGAWIYDASRDVAAQHSCANGCR